jgi:short-subunit dehydrogenase
MMNRRSPNFGLGLLILGCALSVHALRRRRPVGHSFRGQTVVITGGSRGLGFALASRFAAEGAHLVLLARTHHQLDQAAARLRHQGAASVLTIPCDIRDRAAIEAAVDEIVGNYPGIDVLVNNAGVIQVTPFEHAQLEDFADSLAVHFWAPLHFVRKCLPHFKRQGGARVINIASIGGRVAVPHLLPYCAGKFALAGLSDGLHAELARDGVIVTTVTPHLMRTGSHRNVTVRGKHGAEAILFAVASATALTAMNADRAAETIVEASRQGRAHVSPGWQGRAAQLTQALAPELAAAILAFSASHLLPRAAGLPGDLPRQSRDLDLGGITRVFATDEAIRFNQDIAPDERS